MKNQFSRFIRSINSCPSVLFIFIILCVNFLSFVPQNNEEHYLLCAKHFANPDWLSHSFIISDISGNRLLFEFLFGWVVDWFGFEKTIFWVRLLNFFLLAIPMASFFKLLKIKNESIFIILQFFIVADQAFYAGEWIFGSIESKSFAYIFVFWGLVALLKNQYFSWVIFLILATYFHILVGGWFAISCFGLLILQAIFTEKNAKKSFLQIFYYGILYAIALFPLLYYLTINLILDNPMEIEGINLNHIYVYYRNKHHIGLFYNFDYFLEKHALKILLAIIAFLLFLRKKYIGKEAIFNTINHLMLLMLSLGFFFVLVGFIDYKFCGLSGGFMLKSCPYRMQSMAFFIFLTLLIHDLNCRIVKKPKYLKIKNILLGAFFFLMVFRFFSNIQSMLYYQSDKSYTEIISFIQNNTQPTQAIMVLNGKEIPTKKGGHVGI